MIRKFIYICVAYSSEEVKITIDLNASIQKYSLLHFALFSFLLLFFFSTYETIYVK